MLLIVASTNSFAQLTVNSDGSLIMAQSADTVMTKVTIGSSPIPTWRTGLGIDMSFQDLGYNVGVNSKVMALDGSFLSYGAIGLMGTAGNTQSLNYGVCGLLSGTQSGAGVYGSPMGIRGIVGRYAGYFYGNTYVCGDLTAYNFITPSDIRLKENISFLSDDDSNSALSNILAMNVLKYNYKEIEISDEEMQINKDLDKNALEEMISENHNMAQQLHFGLSAQELQDIYPNLVIEGQDGYLGVNYVELVPVLIRSIQELKEEIDELKEELGELKDPERAKNSPEKVSTTLLKKASRNCNKLYQNVPNPSNEQTVIRFQLADNVQEASICIFDLQGKILKKIPVASSQDRIIVNTYEIGSGMFLYSLIVNGQEIDTKKMVILK